MSTGRALLIGLVAGIATLASGVGSRLYSVSAAHTSQIVAWTLQEYVHEGDTGVEPPNSIPLQITHIQVRRAQ